MAGSIRNNNSGYGGLDVTSENLNTFTIGGWFEVQANAYSNGDVYQEVAWLSSWAYGTGVTFETDTDVLFFDGPTDVTIATGGNTSWWYVWWKKSGTTLTAKVRAQGTSTWTTIGTWTVTDTEAEYVAILQSGWPFAVGTYNTAIRSWRLWNVAKSDADMTSESDSRTPVDTTNLRLAVADGETPNTGAPNWNGATYGAITFPTSGTVIYESDDPIAGGGSSISIASYSAIELFWCPASVASLAVSSGSHWHRIDQGVSTSAQSLNSAFGVTPEAPVNCVSTVGLASASVWDGLASGAQDTALAAVSASAHQSYSGQSDVGIQVSSVAHVAIEVQGFSLVTQALLSTSHSAFEDWLAGYQATALAAQQEPTFERFDPSWTTSALAALQVGSFAGEMPGSSLVSFAVASIASHTAFESWLSAGSAVAFGLSSSGTHERFSGPGAASNLAVESGSGFSPELPSTSSIGGSLHSSSHSGYEEWWGGDRVLALVVSTEPASPQSESAGSSVALSSTQATGLAPESPGYSSIGATLNSQSHTGYEEWVSGGSSVALGIASSFGAATDEPSSSNGAFALVSIAAWVPDLPSHSSINLGALSFAIDSYSGFEQWVGGFSIRIPLVTHAIRGDVRRYVVTLTPVRYVVWNHMQRFPAKDPAARRLLEWDLTAEMAAKNTTLVSVTLTEVDCDDEAVDPPTLLIEELTFTPQGRVLAFVADGYVGNVAHVRCHYVMANGEYDHLTGLLPIVHR